MEKNEVSRIPDSDVVVSPNNPDDPNDPVVTTDDPNDPATDAARRRNIEMEKDEQSLIPDPDGPDIVVSPDDPNDPVVTTDDPNTCASVTNTLKEIRAEQEKTPFKSERFSSRSSIKSTYASSFSSRRSIPDPNDPVEPTDEQSGIKSTYVSGSRRRDIEMERDELSAISYFYDDCLWSLPNAFNKRASVQVHFKRRNNNDLESSSSKHYEKRQPIYTKIEIEQLEEILGITALEADIHEPVSQCCIYKVPKDLRNINETAYTPQVISIGPFHHGNKALVEMEKQKFRYILEFQRSRGAEKLKEFKRFIQDNEQLIRNYYQEDSSLKSSEFVNMILRDSVFIIELFLRNMEKSEDFFLYTACLKAAIACDLQLLENQLPYLLLQNLFEFLEFPDHDLFLKLSHLFFFDPKDGVFPKPKYEIEYEIQHFTDLRRYFLLMDFVPQFRNQGEHVRDLPTATKLHGSGVKFKKHEIEGEKAKSRGITSPESKAQTERQQTNPTSSLEISCKPVPCAMRIPGFKGCEIRIPFMKTLELQISRLEIDDRSECLYRNMMALELCHYPDETYICNFILLMDYLINTEKDVDLLVEEGIIFGLLGDNAAVSNMFNNLGLQITPSFSIYHDIGEMLKAHYRRPWNHTMATLKTVYFGDIWKGTATVVAFILLVLTVIQAISSILSLYK